MGDNEAANKFFKVSANINNVSLAATEVDTYLDYQVNQFCATLRT